MRLGFSRAPLQWQANRAACGRGTATQQPLMALRYHPLKH